MLSPERKLGAFSEWPRHRKRRRGFPDFPVEAGTNPTTGASTTAFAAARGFFAGVWARNPGRALGARS